MDQQFATVCKLNPECVTQFLRISSGYVRLDSRISCKEYKLSDCILRAYSQTLPQRLGRGVECRPQPALHVLLQARKARGIQTLGNIDRLADDDDDSRTGLG